MGTNIGFSLADHRDASEAIANSLQDLAALEAAIAKRYERPGSRIYNVTRNIEKARNAYETISRLLGQEMSSSYPFAHNETLYVSKARGKVSNE